MNNRPSLPAFQLLFIHLTGLLCLRKAAVIRRELETRTVELGVLVQHTNAPSNNTVPSKAMKVLLALLQAS
ncbi:hypothetical protein BT69DRAFT_1276821 [Atractiella rhizophila]|nr:hypothetical protein BT69DRAFT_1276821 [Atractiella rhizophila]